MELLNYGFEAGSIKQYADKLHISHRSTGKWREIEKLDVGELDVTAVARDFLGLVAYGLRLIHESVYVCWGVRLNRSTNLHLQSNAKNSAHPIGHCT